MKTILPDLMMPPIKLTPVKLPNLTRAAIQGKLLSIRDDSIMADSIRAGAVTDLNGTIKMILEQAKDNRAGMIKIIGEQLLKDIESL